MIYKGRDKVERIWIGEKAVSVVYLGAMKIWEGVRSCFGSGVWRGKKPWIGKEGWRGR